MIIADLTAVLDAIIPTLQLGITLGFFFALVQKLVRFLISCILGGKVEM